MTPAEIDDALRVDPRRIDVGTIDTSLSPEAAPPTPAYTASAMRSLIWPTSDRSRDLRRLVVDADGRASDLYVLAPVATYAPLLDKFAPGAARGKGEYRLAGTGVTHYPDTTPPDITSLLDRMIPKATRTVEIQRVAGHFAYIDPVGDGNYLVVTTVDGRDRALRRDYLALVLGKFWGYELRATSGRVAWMTAGESDTAPYAIWTREPARSVSYVTPPTWRPTWSPVARLAGLIMPCRIS